MYISSFAPCQFTSVSLIEGGVTDMQSVISMFLYYYNYPYASLLFSTAYTVCPHVNLCLHAFSSTMHHFQSESFSITFFYAIFTC
jgi:hypothetical protein